MHVKLVAFPILNSLIFFLDMNKIMRGSLWGTLLHSFAPFPITFNGFRLFWKFPSISREYLQQVAESAANLPLSRLRLWQLSHLERWSACLLLKVVTWVCEWVTLKPIPYFESLAWLDGGDLDVSGKHV